MAVAEGRALARAQDEVHQAGPLGLEVRAREARLLDLAEAVLGGQVLDLAQVADRVAHGRELRRAARRAATHARRAPVGGAPDYMGGCSRRDQCSGETCVSASSNVAR